MKTSSADNTQHPEAGSGRTRASRAHSLRFGAAAVLVLLGTFAGLTVAGVTPAGASTIDATATIANPDGDTPLSSGASTDEWTVTLPANAACDGDTVQGGYHVYSYLVPEGTDPATVSFTTGLPSTGYGFFNNTGLYYGKVNTAATTGEVIGIPGNLEFAPLLSRGATLDSLLYSNGNTSGVWEGGIACANTHGVVTDYWQTEITFSASGTDPNGFTWTDTAGGAPSAPAAPTTISGNSSATVNWAAPVSGGAFGVSGYVLTPYISGTAQTPIDLGNVTTYNDTGLTNGTAYTFTVAATNSTDFGPPSAQSAPVTPATVPDQPAAPTATEGQASASLTWTAPYNEGANITGYVVTPYIGATAQTPQTFNSNATTETATGLTNATSYTFTVAAINSVGTGAASPVSNAVTPIGVPDAPAAPTATAGNSSATVNWSTPYDEGASVNGYVITPYIGAAPQTPIDVGAVNSDNVTGLANNTTYTFTVAATNSVGTGAASPASNTVTPATVPDAPAAPTATAGNTQAGLTWTAPFDEGSAITGYVIQPYDGATALAPIDVGPSATSYTDSGLNNGDTYTFTVAATNSLGTGAASLASNAVVPDAVPDAPSITSVSSGNATATVNWSTPSDEGSDITGYVVTPYDGANAGSPVDVGVQNAYTFTGLTNGDSYTFTVAATNTVGTGIASDPSSAVVPATVPDPPVTPAATAGLSSAAVTWSAAPNDEGSTITGYVITPYLDGTTAEAAQTFNSPALSETVTGLTKGASYTFTVAAVNGVGTGTASAASNSVTLPNVPGAPTTVGVTAGKASVKVTWKAPSNNGGSAITHYVIKSSAGKSVTVGNVTSDTVTGLTNGTAYTFTVAATNAVGTGAASAKSKSVTPDGLYIVTKTLPKATQGKKYTAVTLTEKNGVGTETWTASGLPAGLTLTTAGKLSGAVKKTDVAKTYSVTVTVKDSTRPTKQTASAKLNLVVAS